MDKEERWEFVKANDKRLENFKADIQKEVAFFFSMLSSFNCTKVFVEHNVVDDVDEWLLGAE